MTRLRPGIVLRAAAVSSVLAALVVPACERADDRVAVTVLADLSASVDLQSTAAESEELIASLRQRLGVSLSVLRRSLASSRDLMNPPAHRPASAPSQTGEVRRYDFKRLVS